MQGEEKRPPHSEMKHLDEDREKPTPDKDQPETAPETGEEEWKERIKRRTGGG